MIRYFALVALGGFAASACGGSAALPPAQPESLAEPVTEEEEAIVEMEAEAEPEATPEPEPAEEAAAQPAPPEIRLISATAAGRPIVQYVGADSLTTTLGQNGGILKLGEATLRIPDGALREGLNVSFAATKTKGPEGGIGAVYKVGPNVISVGPRFQIALPIPEGMSPKSFAIDRAAGQKGRSAKANWEYIAPTKIFTDREPNVALLELNGLFDGHVTLSETSPREP